MTDLEILLSEIETNAISRKYLKLPKKLSLDIRKRLQEQVDIWNLKNEKIYVNGKLLANKFSKIVIGDYGAYIEIEDEDIIKQNISVMKGQEWRLKPTHYLLKFHWYICNDVKLYWQIAPVTYANYKINTWYISIFEITNGK